MTETFTDDRALATWSCPRCPFVIEYSRKMLDDIRLAVVDAFFSLPRGGAEIGGILLGRFEQQRLQIVDYAPIECEHAFGPAFTLSPADQVRLGDMLGQNYPAGLRPVGWYHSHTRSEIALCEADLDVHNRYFPEPWQVALVLRPSTLQPTQAGFFFREADGTIHAQSSYQEFVVEALPLHQLPTGVGEAAPGIMREPEPGAVVITQPVSDSTAAAPPPAEPVAVRAPDAEHHAEAAPEPVPAAEPVAAPSSSAQPPAPRAEVPEIRREISRPEAPPDAPPVAAIPRLEQTPPPFASFVEAHPESQRRWLGIAAGVIAGLALGVLADQARSHSQPPPATAPVVAPVTQRRAPDSEGAALRKQNAELGKQIADLSQQNSSLRKQNEELSKQQSDVASRQADASQHQGELRQQRDDLVKQAAKLKADLAAQTARAQSLQQQLDDLRKQQQRRRLSIQSSDPLP